jgi:hypothetical protein
MFTKTFIHGRLRHLYLFEMQTSFEVKSQLDQTEDYSVVILSELLRTIHD